MEKTVTQENTSVSIFLAFLVCASILLSSAPGSCIRPVAAQQAANDRLQLSFASLPAVVQDLISRIQINNNSTNSALSHFMVLQSANLLDSNGLPIKDIFETTIAFQDRYGRSDSNNNLNVFLQITHTHDTILSVQVAELGGDSISVSAINSNSFSSPKSSEIRIPTNPSSIFALQKTRVFLNQIVEPSQVPTPILSFLHRFQMIGSSPNDISLTYALLQTTPDIFAKNVLGIQNQYVATVAFSTVSNLNAFSQSPGIVANKSKSGALANWNIFLQISYTNDRINSFRGIQFGSDDLQLFINGTNVGILKHGAVIPFSIAKKLGQGHLSVGFGLFGKADSTIAALADTFGSHGLGSPDYGTSFNPKLLLSYPTSMDKHLLFYTATMNVKSGIQDAIGRANANGGTPNGWSVAYDNEPDNGALSTPSLEYNGTKVDPSTGRVVSLAAFYANKAADQVHAAGLKFGIAPASSLYLGKKYPSILDGIDWQKIDYWSLQINSGDGGVKTILDTVEKYALPVKISHPNVSIYVAINENPSGAASMTTSEVAAVVRVVIGKLDGIEFHRYTDSKTVGDMLTVVGR